MKVEQIIRITINGKVEELSRDDAKKVLEALQEVFGKPLPQVIRVPEVIREPYPVWPKSYPQPIPHYEPPQIWCGIQAAGLMR